MFWYNVIISHNSSYYFKMYISEITKKKKIYIYIYIYIFFFPHLEDLFSLSHEVSSRHFV